MVQRWPRASRGAVDSPPRPDSADRWGVARLVAQREAERRARETPPTPPARYGDLMRSEVAEDRVMSPQRSGSGEVGSGGICDDGVGPPAPRAPVESPSFPSPPVPRPPAPPRPLPAPRRPVGRIRGASDQRAPRPRIDPDPSLFGFARRTRSRLGSRLFSLFFVLVFVTITVQTLVSIV